MGWEGALQLYNISKSMALTNHRIYLGLSLLPTLSQHHPSLMDPVFQTNHSGIGQDSIDCT